MLPFWPMDAELTKWFATLGVGGILAGFMFALYRKDIKQFTELWKMATDQLIIVIKENTASNTKLVGMLETMERNALRKTDIEEFVGRRATNSKPKGAE